MTQPPEMNEAPLPASEAAPTPSRRRWLMAAAGVAAAAGGAGLALWRSPNSVAPGPQTSSAEEAFWQLQLHTPQGSEQTAQAVQAYRGRPLLVNFWATWCPPCVRELPMLSAFALQAAPHMQVLGLAVDQAPNVQRWLQRQPLEFPVLMAGASGIGLTRSLGNATGGLPFSVLFDRAGNVQQRKIGELSDADLQQWLAAARV